MILELPQSSGERVAYRRLGDMPASALSADLSGHAFGPHTHDAFAIGVVVSGAQRFRYRAAIMRQTART